MIPGNTFTDRANSRRGSTQARQTSDAYMADYDKQRRYYFRDEDNSRYRHEEQQFESIFLIPSAVRKY
jgi:hypothetical protein